MENVVYAYTRKQAIEDGVLIDVSETAKEMGFVHPVAVTSTVWNTYIVPPHELTVWQDIAGRTWDMLWMLKTTIKKGRDSGPRVEFNVIFHMGDRDATVVRFRAHCGPGDDCKPVMTIMMPDED